MTKQERELIDEVRLQVQGLLEQYTYLLKIQATMVDEIRNLRVENEKLKAHIKLNEDGRLAAAGIPPSWRG